MGRAWWRDSLPSTTWPPKVIIMSDGSAIDRREFLSKSTHAGLGLAAGGVALAATSRARAAGPNDKIVLGLVGLRGRGSVLGPDFAKRDDCEVAYLADVDTSWFGQRVPAVESAQGRAPKTVQDFRRVRDEIRAYLRTLPIR